MECSSEDERMAGSAVAGTHVDTVVCGRRAAAGPVPRHLWAH